MIVLVVNSGSSSIKYQLLDMDNEKVLCKGLAERIGIPGSRIVHKKDGEKFVIEHPMANHDEALQLVLQTLKDEKMGAIKDFKEIDAVGHRVVHGGEKFSGSVLIDDEVINAIEEFSYLAPLHNPPNLMGIKAIMKLLPGVPNVAVFDTAFHAKMPKKAYLYAIPYEYYEKYKIRRYGFHGTSHRYVSRRTAEILGLDYNKSKIITVHLGNGASIAAVMNGKSVDTSMGFTPLEGLVMGTRSGDLDPSIVTFLIEKEGLSPEEVYTILNKKSGVLGLTSNFSSDMRDIEDKALENDPLCRLVLDIYEYRIAKYIGAYVAAMNGVDAISFTAGVGENSPITREEICENYLSYLGIKIDKEKNNVKGEERIISTPDSKVKVLIVPTNEELMIARDTKEIIEKGIKKLEY
ncbi:acetate kinase A/propionate kinase 2 [Thermosipho africanus H17ap60334]|jgi:acetate kinase|uniref:Acetate kinase n=1 Tax=Thermosipho africanus (strain TCF52B) TaxID=484019 RepID=ACKA_THEAB|nr:acetate kinase [Thermosipho africanus]B7IDH3.1 RecName: Full=Acetate kinase; AltName: Full=Acetokinase [Thermosipho africanus TCF52B]MDK2839293.1 acetate kinase [Thermosipho sp. (in: thermotogales)]ACJ76050.1 acetate kinase [Thermosipho africanus TCF52B]EKF49418.1 acetate kinase A/propionate kinase 2 [Thermosipho africanus H17ap60334]RDI92180.1 acetate kinase A/propionate kinase 2 [Thermosipho africanus Ob7]HCF38252.1 acetate kinase [Thermosipho africanus]